MYNEKNLLKEEKKKYQTFTEYMFSQFHSLNILLTLLSAIFSLQVSTTGNTESSLNLLYKTEDMGI